jgi:hypothetical protein
MKAAEAIREVEQLEANGVEVSEVLKKFVKRVVKEEEQFDDVVFQMAAVLYAATPSWTVQRCVDWSKDVLNDAVSRDGMSRGMSFAFAVARIFAGRTPGSSDSKDLSNARLWAAELFVASKN